MLSSSSITIILAAYNEEEGIAPTISEINQVLTDCEIIVVDGKSTDRTVELARELGTQVFFQKGKGKGDALIHGLSILPKDTTYVVFIDADYTYPAQHIKEMSEILENNPKIGMILGNRFSKKYADESDKNQFYIGNKILGFAQKLIGGVNLIDPYSGLRIIRFELLKDWKPQSKGFDIEAELNQHIQTLGYEIKEFPIIYRKRLGKKKLGFLDGLYIFRRIIIKKITK